MSTRRSSVGVGVVKGLLYAVSSDIVLKNDLVPYTFNVGKNILRLGWRL